MARPIIVPISVGAVCCLVALISAGLLQPIDCSIDVNKLLDELNKPGIQLETVEGLLDGVGDEDEVRLYAFSVRSLRGFKQVSEAGCEQNELGRIAYANVIYTREETKNQGLSKFSNHYFQVRVNWCLERIAEKFNRENSPEEVSREVLETFYTGAAGINKGCDVFLRLKFALLAYSGLPDNGKSRTQKEELARIERLKKQKRRLEFSCKMAHDFFKFLDRMEPIIRQRVKTNDCNLVPQSQKPSLGDLWSWHDLVSLCKVYLFYYEP